MIYKKVSGQFSAVVQLTGEKFYLGEFPTEERAALEIKNFKAGKSENSIERLEAIAHQLRVAARRASDELSETLKSFTRLAQIIPPGFHCDCGCRMAQLPNQLLRCPSCSRECSPSAAPFRAASTPSAKVEFTLAERALIEARKSASDSLERELVLVLQQIERARIEFFKRCRFGTEENTNAE